MGKREEQKQREADEREVENVRQIYKFCLGYPKLRPLSRRFAVLAIESDRLAKMWRKYRHEDPKRTGRDFLAHIEQQIAKWEATRKISDETPFL